MSIIVQYWLPGSNILTARTTPAATADIDRIRTMLMPHRSRVERQRQRAAHRHRLPPPRHLLEPHDSPSHLRRQRPAGRVLPRRHALVHQAFRPAHVRTALHGEAVLRPAYSRRPVLFRRGEDAGAARRQLAEDAQPDAEHLLHQVVRKVVRHPVVIAGCAAGHQAWAVLALDRHLVLPPARPRERHPHTRDARPDGSPVHSNIVRPVDTFWRDLEAVAAREVGRGSTLLLRYTEGNLEKAAASLLERRADVSILTGFFIGSAAETDGPIGAVQLAAAIIHSGGTASIVTDHHCFPVLDVAVRAAGVATKVLTKRPGNESHLIAIERPGPSWNGGPPRNMRGEDISAWAPILDFGPGPWTRIGIGDGGNELGMGALPHDAVAGAVANGALIHCEVDCDLPLVGGTSNWAAAALVAGMAHLNPAIPRELLAPEWSRTVLEAMVDEAGAIDGVLRRASATVDGLSWEDYAAVLAAIAAL